MYGLYGFYGFMVKIDNTAYQALVLVWLGCGNKRLETKLDTLERENKLCVKAFRSKENELTKLALKNDLKP